MKKFPTFLAAGALSLVLAVQPAAAAASFPDVPKSNRFHDEVNYLVDQKIISGYSNGTFQPKKNVTRGEAAIMIGRMLKLDGSKRNTKFKDVSKSDGASGYIAAATDKGIISGYPDGTFRANENISRGDMAIILDRTWRLEFGSIQKFKDVGDNMKASEAIYNIAREYITTGFSDGTFRPKGTVTREQFSAFLARGISPVYRQRVVGNNGYSHNMTKQYIFGTLDGDVQSIFQQGIQSDQAPNYNGFAWKSTNLKTGKAVYSFQEETSSALITGYPFSEYYTDLKFPLKAGVPWLNGQGEGTAKITNISKTVKTPYKTFTNAVETTTEMGYKDYYVKGVGLVKIIDPAGKVVQELKSMK
ncbi:S-layer homology domain-containing protein [Sporosarcina sp. BI001-red]|uniref:S-layer homology domain-containing protein n=1 Tax=Sporosarcina sp. BI001-red TaxID=2282866 RepID=UPI000E23D880|nr:S-layer homology domain-containing protein [Sporosarcina sp. BI001-red]REB08705.1 S-layer homology domain-containing protein [Sporosarcina sp. BI001-red]